MPIAFEIAGVFSGSQDGPNILNNPTSLQFGPDGRLYVSEQNGSINALTVEKQGDTWVATSAEQLADANGNELVKNIQNHFDDGSESGLGNRQVTGIVVAGTAAEPILYISSSNPDIASNGEKFLDTNSGVVTQASFSSTSGEWEVVDLIRGLPRSEENHSVNGMLLSEDGNSLLLQVGGFTNNGAPSGFFSYTNEYALSGAILEIDLVAVNDLPTQIDPQGGQGDTSRAYKYDLPTLDDPNIENVTDGVGEDEFGMDEDGPWGGNDGLNMAILPADAPLSLYADGLRNAYDLTRTPDGKIYSVDNGSNGGLGGEPATEANDDDGDGIPNEAIATPNTGSFGEGEPLIQIVEGGYYYHANPVRSNQNQSWTVYDDDGNPDALVGTNFVPDISALVPDAVQVADGFLIDPSKFLVGNGQTLADLSEQERNDRLLLSGETIDSDALEQNDPDGAGPGQQVIEILGSSTNGITAYDSGGLAFGGTIDGALFVTQFNDNITLLNINDAGTDLDPILEEGPDGIFGTADDTVQDADGVLFVANNTLGVPLANPLDVVVGPEGTLWVAEIGGNEITVLAPGTVGDQVLDADFDGILNVDDPFTRDATNGTSVVVSANNPVIFDFDPDQDGNLQGPDGYGGGLTGVMIDGTTNFEEFFQSPRDPNDPNNSQIQLDNVKFITAAGGGNTVIEDVSNGDPFEAQNSGEFLFHTGVTFAPAVETATITWTLFNPAADITGSFQQIGGYIGTGDQSNYLKVVAIQTGSIDGVQVTLEDGDAVAQTYTIDTDIFDAASIPQSAKIFIDLEIDFIAETATPIVTYETNSGDVTVTGAPVALAGSAVLEAIKGQATAGGEAQGVAVGLFSSNTQQPEANTFQAVFDDIAITASEAALPPIAGDDSVGTGVGAAVEIPVSTLLANDTDGNDDILTVTGVANPVNGTVSIDGGVVTFTPNEGFEGQASFEYTVSDGNGGTDTATVTVDVSASFILYRVNAGDVAVAAIDDGPDWAANTGTGAQSGDGFSVNTGNISTHNISGRDPSVPDYVPQAIFALERWDPPAAPEMVFSFGEGELAAGTYTVNLFTGNGFSGTSQPGERVFDVEIEGDEVFSDVDLSALFGHQVGGLLTADVQVTDGTLDIEWLHQTENPTVNGIEIIGPPIVPPVPTVDIVSGDQSISESGGQVLVSVLTSQTVTDSAGLTFTYVIEGGTATPEADYSPDASLNGAGTATFTGTATIAGGSSDFQIPIDILPDDLVESDETFTVTITSVGPGFAIGDGQATITILDDDTVTQPGEAIIRINAGGPEVAANDGGIVWSEDGADVVNGSAFGGPSSPFLVDRGIDGTTSASSDNVAFGDNTPNGPGLNETGAPDALFTTERFSSQDNPNNIGYAFDLANGDYTVNLYFDELFFQAAGERVFDIEIEGVLVADDFDTYVAAGNSNDTVLQSYDVTLTDGTLNLEFLKTPVNNPHVAAIEILATGTPTPTVSVAAPDPASVEETGDTGSTELLFPVTFSAAPDGPVTLDYEVDIDGTVTPGSATLSADGAIAVQVPNDDADDGADQVTLTLTGVSSGVAQIGTASAEASVTEDDGDGLAPGTVLYRVNAGGPEIAATDGGPDWGGDAGTFGAAGNSPYLSALPTTTTIYNNDAGSSYAGTVESAPGIPAGTPLAIFDTERGDRGGADPTMQWQFPVAADFGLVPGDTVEVRLYFAEIFGGIDAAGERVFDVSVDGTVPAEFDDIDTFAETGAGNIGTVRSAIVAVDADGNIDLDFINGIENPAIKGIEILVADEGTYQPPLDDLFGTAVELSDERLSPTQAGEIADGATLAATQEGPSGVNGVRDRDYVTIEIPDGKILTGIFLDDYVNANPTAPDGFLAIQSGAQITVDPTTGQPDTGADGLLGAVIYGAGSVGTNLLDTMAAGGTVDPATGFSLPGFDPALTGQVTIWLNQGAGPGTPTLRFDLEDDPGSGGTPGAYLANPDGDIVIEVEDARFETGGLNGWEFQTEHDLDGPGEIDENHEAFNGDGFIEWDGAQFFGDPSNGQLSFAFIPETTGVYYVNLRSSKETDGPNSEHNDAFTRITDANGDPLEMLPGFKNGEVVQPTFTGENGNFNDGWHKTFQSGGPDNDWKFANKNVDNTGIPIAYELEAGVAYNIEIAARSNNFAIDRIHLALIENPPGPGQVTNPITPPEFAEASPRVSVDPVGEAVLTINENSDGIEVSNFGNGSFTITNTGTKDISYIEIDVTDALLPDAVFDPFGVAGDSTAKPITVPDEGGTGLVTTGETDGNGNIIFGQGSIGTNYIGAGGIAGFETIRLEFTDFNPGESISFGADMDPNSIAGSTKATLDSGASLAGAGNWDVGGIAGAELTGSTFTVGYDDATTSVGQLQGQGTGQQSGAKALSSQASENFVVSLDVNGVAAGGEGTYEAGGPTVTIQGPAGEVARIVLAKGFIVPFTNEFPDTADPNEYHDQLDAQLGALAASGFPANNVVEYQYVDVTLDGTVQDISELFNFDEVAAFDLSVPDLTNEFGVLEEDKLALGFAASVIDPASDLAKGPVTSPVHLTFSDNAAPAISDPGAQTVDEGGAFSLQIAATDPEGDGPLAYALEVLDTDGLPVAEPAFAIDPDTGLITGTAPLVLEETAQTLRVTVTDAAGSVGTLDIPLTVADTVADADLSLTKTASDLTPDFGDDVVFTVTVTNEGPDAATGVVVADLLPSGYAFAGGEGSVGTYDETTGLWTVGTVPAGASETLTLTGTVLSEAPAEPETVIYRVNAGADSVVVVGEPDSVDATEPDFPNDTPNGNLNGNNTTAPGTAPYAPGITRTGGQEFGNENGAPVIDLSLLPADTVLTSTIFETERFGVPVRTNTEIFPEQPRMEWDFEVENGDYEVRLYFAELFVGVAGGSGADLGVGDRIFDVEIEDAVVLDDYDLFADVGALTAVLKSFDVTVTDGTLDIGFKSEVDNAKISAIEIVQKGTPGGSLDYLNTAEIVAADAFDPDSTPGNGEVGEDDLASVAVTPVAGGLNAVTIAATDPDGAEGDPTDPAQFTVFLEEAADTDTVVTYTVGGTATADADYTALAGTVTILAGELSAPIDLTVLEDLDVEDPETVVVTLTDATGDANLALGTEGEATATIASDDLPPLEGAALIEITPDGTLGASTFGGTSSFQISNTGAAGDANITSISIDLSTGILPDMVFDPVGAGGDATAQVFSPNAASAALTGLVPVGDPAVDPFSEARNGGFDVITVEFTDFAPGEQFTFSVDVDPNSIQAVPGAGNAGAVSGYELIGSTVTITFDDGTTSSEVVTSLYDDGSLGGAQSLGQSVISTGAALAAPVIALEGPAVDVSTGLLGDQVFVPEGATQQLVKITGAAGAFYSLLQMDARLFIASGDDPFDVQPDEAAFYANEAVSGKNVLNGQLDANGEALVPVTLLATPSGNTTPDGGLNHFVAVLSDAPYAPDQPVSQTSNTLVLTEAPAVEISVAATLDGAEPGTPGQFEVSLAEVSAVDTVIAYTVDAGSTATADADYTALSGTVTIPAGSLSATIDVAVLDDPDFEEDETVSITLAEVVQSDGRAVIGATDAATVTITSDDLGNTAPEITSGTTFQVTEGVDATVFTAAATDAEDDPIEFILGGADALLFDLDAGTGAVSFVDPPVFTDGGDNTFEIELTASDGELADIETVIVEVLKDTDGDGVADIADNAIFVANTDQRDSNGDGYGNVIDADLTNDGIVLIDDLVAFRDAFGMSAPITPEDPGLDADFDGDGLVLISDLLIFRDLFGQSIEGQSFIDLA